MVASGANAAVLSLSLEAFAPILLRSNCWDLMDWLCLIFLSSFLDYQQHSFLCMAVDMKLNIQLPQNPLSMENNTHASRLGGTELLLDEKFCVLEEYFTIYLEANMQTAHICNF